MARDDTAVMRQWWPGVVALLLVAACGSGSGTAASCAGPQLVALTPEHVAAGAAVTVTVEWLHDGCNDTINVGAGGPHPANEETPRTNVPLYFAQQPDEKLVGTMSGSGAHYRGVLRFAVPSSARPGPATLLLGPERQQIAALNVSVGGQ